MDLNELPEIKLDPDALYREETYSDRRVGVLRQLIPVKKDGSVDDSRETIYHGSTQLMTQMGALPVSFEIQAASLEEALDKFPEAAKQGIQDTVEQLQEMRREAASSIITPDQAGGMGGMGGGPGGIQMP
jgi:hypothetical protein